MRRRLGFLLVVPVVLGAYLFGAQSGLAIPNAQENCAFDTISTNSTTAPQAITGMSVTVNNGTLARRVVVQFSADVGVDTGGEVRISYKVDGAAPAEDTYGPANLANNQEFREANTVIAVLPLGSGAHTITPYWRVSGVAGKNAFMDSRCFTAEARTK